LDVVVTENSGQDHNDYHDESEGQAVTGFGMSSLITRVEIHLVRSRGDLTLSMARCVAGTFIEWVLGLLGGGTGVTEGEGVRGKFRPCGGLGVLAKAGATHSPSLKRNH
jgi:hypothetical protein